MAANSYDPNNPDSVDPWWITQQADPTVTMTPPPAPADASTQPQVNRVPSPSFTSPSPAPPLGGGVNRKFSAGTPPPPAAPPTPTIPPPLPAGGVAPTNPLTAGQVVRVGSTPVLAASGSNASQNAADLAQQTALANMQKQLGTKTGGAADPFANPGGTDTNAIIQAGFKAAYGKDPTPDQAAYWAGKWKELTDRGTQLGNPNYAWDRLIGAGATGSDAAMYGPYAGGDTSLGDAAGIQAPAGPGSEPGVNGSTDPYSQMLNDKLMELLTNNGMLSPSSEATQLETARSSADRARNAEMAGVSSELANRGQLDQFDPAGGAHAAAAAQVEHNDIGPNFTQAVQNYTIANSKQANDNLMSAIQLASTHQKDISDIALQTLSQNTQFNEFLATFGLQKDQVLYELQNGQNSQLIALLAQYLQAASKTTGGTV